MKATLSVLCAGLALTWVAAAGAQQPQQHRATTVQQQPGQSGQSGQSGETGTSGQTGTESGSGMSGQSGMYGESHESSSHSREVKLIGCVAQGTSSGEYVLNNVQAESGKHGKNKSNMGQTGTSGTTGSEADQTSMSFDLVPGSSRVDLSKYVGRKVEIRGRVEPEQGGAGMSSQGTSGTMSGEQSESGQSGSMSGQSGSQSGSMSGQSGSMSGSQSSTGAVTHRVRVSSVKQLGSSCQ